MKRRKFIQKSAMAAGSILIMQNLFAKSDAKIYGHGNMLYSLDTAWSQADASKFPVNDCHEMVQDKHHRIILLTNETKNNILIYTTRGKLLQSWGHEFPGAHGLTLHNENGEEFLYITDTEKR